MNARFFSRGIRERQASDLLGLDVRSVPKSALAVVAVYLALAIDESAGFEGAGVRVFKEWELLYRQGIVKAAPPRRKP